MATRKILMVTYDYYPSVGGGIRYQKDIVDYFRNKGDTVDVLTVNGDGTMCIESNAQGSVIRLPKLGHFNSATISLPYISTFGKLAPGYDILHFNFPNPIAEVAMIRYKKKLEQVKKVVLYHADIVPAKRFSWIYNKFYTTRFLKLMDDIIVSSPNLSKYSPHLPPFREKVSVIPFGIDLGHYVPASSDKSSPEPSSQDIPHILFVGRLSRYKGIDILIQAMKQTPGNLSIVGSGSLKEPLIQLRNEQGLNDRVTFHGYVSESELLRQYQQADILVLPSTDAGEAFGYVLVEAMACRTALISTELKTGTSYVNAHDETGFVVQPKDVDALGKALRTLAENPDMLVRFKDQALRRAHEQFSIERMQLETEEIYDKTSQASEHITQISHSKK